jgi:hypothetical protein
MVGYVPLYDVDFFYTIFWSSNPRVLNLLEARTQSTYYGTGNEQHGHDSRQRYPSILPVSFFMADKL